MNSIIKSQLSYLRELLDTSNEIGIVIGENQNVDIVGAALALYLVLQAEGKNVQIVSKKDITVEVSSLVGANKVGKTFGGLSKIFTISVPYREGDIEKVSYNIEGDRLNVNLFAEEKGIDLNEKDIEYIRKGSSPSLIITVGVLTERELEGLVDLDAVKTIHIDRNPQNSLLGDVALIDPSFSSVSEIVADTIRELSLLPDVDAFQNLMDGIIYATRNFTTPTTSPFAFEAAGFLLQNGAKRKEKSNDPRPQLPRGNDRQNNSPRNSFLDDLGLDDQPQPQPQRGNKPNNNSRQDDRNRNFPNENLFLNPRPPRVQNQNQNQGQNRPNNQPKAQMPNPVQNNPQPMQPKPKMNMPFDPTTVGREAADRDMPADVMDTPYVEGSEPTDIPDDWFLPKVFKGSRKGN